jgi:hypothetical protein
MSKSPQKPGENSPTERWDRIQAAADDLLAPSPQFEKGIPGISGIKATVEGLAQLSVLEKWIEARVEAESPEPAPIQTQAQAQAQAPTPAKPPIQTSATAPSVSARSGDPAFVNADPRLRAALNRIHEKTIEAAKSRLRPGSKLIRPGLEGFRRDDVPVIDGGDIKENASDSKWIKSDTTATRILRGGES